MLAEKLKNWDIDLNTDGESLSVTTTKIMTDEQRQFIRSHKSQLITEIQEAQQKESESLICSLKLRDDRSYVRQFLLGVYGSKRLAIVNEYLNQWQQAADAEPSEIKKQNAGRFKANTWLRERNQ